MVLTAEEQVQAPLALGAPTQEEEEEPAQVLEKAVSPAKSTAASAAEREQDQDELAKQTDSPRKENVLGTPRMAMAPLQRADKGSKEVAQGPLSANVAEPEIDEAIVLEEPAQSSPRAAKQANTQQKSVKYGRVNTPKTPKTPRKKQK